MKLGFPSSQNANSEPTNSTLSQGHHMLEIKTPCRGFTEITEQLDQWIKSLNISNGLLTVYEMYQIRKQLLSVADAGLETAQLNLDLSTEKFKNGSINSFNFRDVQIIFINSEFSRLEAVYNLINTHTELLRATGGIISEFE